MSAHDDPPAKVLANGASEGRGHEGRSLAGCDQVQRRLDQLLVDFRLQEGPLDEQGGTDRLGAGSRNGDGIAAKRFKPTG